MDWEILGHEWAADMLQQHIVRNEVRQAYLFAGPSGIGRRTLALRFAQAINCVQPPQPGMFCGQCRPCNQSGRMQHADLSIVQAEKPGGSLLIDQVRELQHMLSLSPFEARFRVALLLRFEEATPAAQNALLKTLEETPPSVIMILTANDPESLLPTIVSRCETLRLRPLPLKRLQTALIERWKIPQEEARRLAHLCGGRPGLALKLSQDAGLLAERQELAADVLYLLSCSRRERFAYVDRFSRDREIFRQAFEVWSIFWRDVMLAASGAEIPQANLDLQNEIQELARQVEFTEAAARVASLEQALAQLDANLNARLLAENILLDWPKTTA